MHCAMIINYQGNSTKIGGLEIPITQLGGIVKVGNASLDPVTLQKASELIQALDIAQFNSCRSVPFAAESDRYKLIQDTNTQQNALITLLVNLNAAQDPANGKAAVVTAANVATPSTSAATSPPAPNAVAASPAVAPAVTPTPSGPAPAAPVTVTPTTVISDLSEAAAALQAASQKAK